MLDGSASIKSLVIIVTFCELDTNTDSAFIRLLLLQFALDKLYSSWEDCLANFFRFIYGVYYAVRPDWFVFSYSGFLHSSTRFPTLEQVNSHPG